MPRLFAALEIPFNISQELALLRSGLPGARWIEPEDYHITLSFFGDIESRIADELTDSLSQIKRNSFEIKITHLDVFGKKKPRLLYARVETNLNLTALRGEIDRRGKILGLAKDRLKFRPHISIARLEHVKLNDLLSYLSRRSLRPASFIAQRFVLMSSKASIGGGPYVTEDYWPLATCAG